MSSARCGSEGVAVSRAGACSPPRACLLGCANQAGGRLAPAGYAPTAPATPPHMVHRHCCLARDGRLGDPQNSIHGHMESRSRGPHAGAFGVFPYMGVWKPLGGRSGCRYQEAFGSAVTSLSQVARAGGGRKGHIPQDREAQLFRRAQRGKKADATAVAPARSAQPGPGARAHPSVRGHAPWPTPARPRGNSMAIASGEVLMLAAGLSPRQRPGPVPPPLRTSDVGPRSVPPVPGNDVTRT